MIKILLTLFFVGCLGNSGQSVGQFYTSNYCTCEQLQYQSDCTSMGPQCTWSDNSCSTLDCTKVTDAKACAANLKCMWTQNSSGESSCKFFTFCSQFSGSSQLQCLNISNNCPFTDGTKCGSSNQLYPCSHFTAQQYCQGYISQDGVCMWTDGTGCRAAQDCTLLNQQQCITAPKGCKYTENKCSQLLCTDLTSQESCTYVMDVIYKGYYQLCSWNSTTGKCANAQNYGGLGQGNCYQQTMGTARWVSTSAGGECLSCYAQTLFALIVALFIIMI
ncbi:unnamed protein product (macronuclear) [Paramecium tetraurelia]|uniref:Mini antigen n=1 Tax=Paramecium tetraurelia TaxID=5888 RepID=A0DMI2_PARTE|nr:uncharacterized protein GSPATT00018467001 [Paramecium tetraurelia]CAK84249.1 unnamed protein product [Paramecium tetraurelia]|eukprot:XP_001451646.1 hypothetical protein (macronuclear) [Paramecium tetraurelia strain d4-2]